MRIVFSTRYTYPVHAKRVARLRTSMASARTRRRSAVTFLALAFGE
jgi:hypothetical protein